MNDADTFDFGLQLQELRKANGWSQQQLADFLDISRTTIGNWESNVIAPQLSNLRSLARIFRTTTDHLLGMKSQDYIYIADLTEHRRHMLVWLAEQFHLEQENEK